MKNTRRLLAVLLVLAMVLTLVPLSVFAAGNKTAATAKKEAAAPQETKLGFKSTAFRENNSYRYAKDELVRAIIVMDAKPAGEATGTRAVAKAKVAAQHETLRKSMQRISYSELFEYDSLLNGVAVETAYGNLDAISDMDGVKAVYIANHYDAPSYDVKMESSNEMTGLAIAHQFGLHGSGTVIAVLDTGMTAGHEAFAVYDGMLQTPGLSEADAKLFIDSAEHGTYVSAKIPFAYDYADRDNDAEDTVNGHGPHVSGIAAGYAEAEDGAVTFMGAAPDAQLLEMKVFSSDTSNHGTSSDIYFAALEDAYELGADVINMSLGAQNGFTYDAELENEVYGNMYQILEDAGIVCSISAGNEGSMADNTSNWAGSGYVTSDYADYGTVGSPSTYDGNLSVASLENAEYPTNVLKVGDLNVPYFDSSEDSQFFNAMVGVEANYVDCGFGYPEDFADADVAGKIALISRGDITFQEKVDNAAAAGAIAAIVYNNEDGVIYMSIDPYAIPAASITKADGEALLALLEDSAPEAKKTVSVDRVATKPAMRADEIVTATYTEMPEDGDPVVLYSAKDGVILAYSAESEDDGEYLTAWNQKTEAATVNGTTLTASWDDAGVLYAMDMEDGTWAFVDEYEYDYNDEMWLLYNDGTYVGTIGEATDAEIYYILEPAGDGFKFHNEASNLYLMIEDGMLYDTADASKATVLSFYVVGDGDDSGDDDKDGDTFKRVDTLEDGAEIIIYNPTSGMALSGEAVATYYKAGVEVAPADDKLTTSNTDIVWTVEATDGGYYISNSNGKLSSDGTYNSIPYDGSNAVWHLDEADGGVYVINNADKYLEWNASKSDFTAYNFSDTYAAAMTMQIFAKDEGTVGPIVDPKAPIMTFPEEKLVIDNEKGWLMSDFSGWGCTPSLTLKPMITGVGGNVNSVAYNTTSDYALMSGTSMSAPNVSGYMAVLLSYLMEDSGLTKVERAAKAEALAESTAYVLPDESGYVYSPRKQGSGLIDILAAIGTDAYIEDPIQNLFDSTEGEWEFTFTVKNEGEADKTYGVTPVVMYDYPTAADFGDEEASDIHVYNTLTSDYLQKAGSCASKDFTDVDQSLWYHEAVDYVIANNLMGSTKTDKLTFEPNTKVSRAMVATILYAMVGRPEVEYTGIFADVPSNAWFAAPIEWCAQNGLASGKGEGKFDPNGNVTRQELAIFMYRLAEYFGEDMTGTADLSTFADAASIPSWSKSFLEWAVDRGIISGIASGDKVSVDPTSSATRCQFAAILKSFMGGSCPDGGDFSAEYPESVTVPAGGTADVTVKITLTDEVKAVFEENYPNGNFVEGYVFLTPEDEEDVEIHATYMGFYGDWMAAPIMEQHDWRDVVDIDTYLNTTEADEEGNTYADYGYTYLDFADFEINTDINLAYALNYYYLTYAGQLYGGYAGDNLFAYADFNEKHISISEGEDGISDTLYMLPMNIRNCRHMIMVVSDAATGEVYYVDDTEYLPKAYYDADYGYWSNTGDFMWDGTDLEGNILASDTVVDISFYCNLAYGEDALGTIAYEDLKTAGADFLNWSFQCTVDNDVPEVSYEYDAATQTLTVTATDNQYLAEVALYAGEELIAEESFSDDEAGLTKTVVFEDVPTDTLYTLEVADYATNIMEVEVIAGNVEMATVTFAIPDSLELDGELTVSVPVGGKLTMPAAYGEVDGGAFVAWLSQELDGVLSSADLYDDANEWVWDEMVFDGDEYTVTEDVTFYALIERATEYYDVHEELSCCVADQADWSGTWAFDGYDFTVEGNEDTYDYLLSADLSTYALTYDNEAEYVEYGNFGDAYLYGALDEHLFEIEMVDVDDDGYGVYTIKTSEGKYLAIVDGVLILADSADDASATWDIYYDSEGYTNIVYNRGSDFILAFDETTGLMGAVNAEDASVYEPNNLYLFGLSAVDYEYYTASVKD